MLIENWREAWKLFSVQLMVVIGLIAAAEPYLPQLAGVLPDAWVAWVAPFVVLARLISQRTGKPYDRR